MLGALEVKAISRLVREHRAEWKPLHTAVMNCLLAHRNRRSGSCFPERKLMAAHANVSERTVDRALAQLVAWGAIEREQPRAVSGQQFRQVQYSFLFELPQAADIVCESEEKSCAKQPGRATKSGGAVRQNRGEPCDKIDGAIRKEGKDLMQGKGGSNTTPPRNFSQDSRQGCDVKLNKAEQRKLHNLEVNARVKQKFRERWAKGPGYQTSATTDKPGASQKDFDERDLRKMAQAWNTVLHRNPEGKTRVSGMTQRQVFEAVCELAGVTVTRGIELDELRKKWPENVPDWLMEASDEEKYG
jgi:hypothetical protein